YRADAAGASASRSVPQLLRHVSPLFAASDEAPSARPRVDARWSDIQLRALHELYEAIFQPIAKHLHPGQPLILVPDGALYYLPFEMLVTGFLRRDAPQYLLAQHPISYAYSAGLLLGLPEATEAPPSAALLIANPDSGARAGSGADPVAA